MNAKEIALIFWCGMFFLIVAVGVMRITTLPKAIKSEKQTNSYSFKPQPYLSNTMGLDEYLAQ